MTDRKHPAADYIEAHALETTRLPRSSLALDDLRDLSSIDRAEKLPTAVVIRRPKVEDAMACAFQASLNELLRLEAKSMEEALTPAETTKLQRLVDSITRLSREQRAIQAEERGRLGALSTEELTARALEALERLQ